ncbi:MAG: hypothetical protein MZV64_64725 [Ignavibacteriales bacterium]|nr:hypothetical protein [Ignavibacteriales bacterium]
MAKKAASDNSYSTMWLWVKKAAADDSAMAMGEEGGGDNTYSIRGYG